MGCIDGKTAVMMARPPESERPLQSSLQCGVIRILGFLISMEHDNSKRNQQHGHHRPLNGVARVTEVSLTEGIGKSGNDLLVAAALHGHVNSLL
jgi:hypothetical protein